MTYIEGQSTDILRNNQADVATLIKTDEGVVRFGTVRLHEPQGPGQGLLYTGLDVPKGVIAKFKFSPKAPGPSQLEISTVGLDLRNADLDPMEVSVSGSVVSVVEMEVQR